MKKWFKAAFSILMCAAMVLGGVSCSDKNHGSTTTQTTSTSTNASTSEDLQTANTIAGKFTDRIISDGDAAILAVKDAAKQLGVTNAAEELSVESVNTIGNTTYYRLQCGYKGVPVYGGDFVVMADANGEAKGVVSNAYDINETISVIATASAEAIQESIGETVGDSAFYLLPSQENLVIYYDAVREQNVLAYSMLAFSRDAQISLIVDANNGEVLQSFELTFTLSASIPSVDEMLNERVDVYDANGYMFCQYLLSINSETYYFDEKNLYDTSGVKRYTFDRGRVYDLNGKQFIGDIPITAELYLLVKLSDGTVRYLSISDLRNQSVKNDERASQLVEGLATAHGFFEEIFGRNGYDDKDGDIIAVVDDYLAIEVSAYAKYWLDKVIIGFSPNEEITVGGVAHEYMHTVEQKTVGMDYVGESGAIMEGYSDIFGELVEDWFSGGLNGDCDWRNFDRNMSKPSSGRNPSVYGGRYWRDPSDVDNDHGWVHNNSTVVSHVAYLMTRNGVKGTALSTEQLADLWYNALYLLPKDCTFQKLRECIELTATTLHLTEAQKVRVSEVFDEIGVEIEYEQVNVDSSFLVYDANQQLYSGYDVSIQKYNAAQKQYILFAELPAQGDYVRVHLPEGKYRLVITNNAEPMQIVSKHIATSTRYTDNTFIIYTDFTDHTHSFGDWEVIKEATLTETGLKERSCRCGEKETEIIPVLSDLVVNGVKLALRADGQSYVVVGVTGMHAQIDIPAAYEGLPVVEIGEYGLANHWYMESVHIPSSIRTISKTAFVGSKNLSNIDVATDHSDFASVGGHLYSKDGKTLLVYAVGQWNTAFEVPEGVTTIAQNAFYDSELSEITLPSSLTRICSASFVNCKSLFELIIPDSVAVIERYAFYECDYLTLLCVAQQKPSGWEMNWDSTSTQSDTFYRVVWGYVEDAEGSRGLEFWLNDDDTYNVGGMGECTDSHVVIPSTHNGKPVTTIAGDGFWSDAMTTIEIPESIIYIDPMPLNVTGTLTTIIVAENNPNYASVGGNLYNKDKTQLLLYASGKTASHFTVPEGVTSIGSYAFFSATNLTSVTVSGNVTEIGSHAFRDCDNLKRVYMGDGVKSIGAFAFAMCESLESVRFGLGLERIQNEAFYACNTLADISLPNAVMSIGASAFADTAYYKTASNWENGVLYIGEYLIASQSGAMQSAYTVKTGTVGIAAGAFLHKNYRLTSVTMPDTVKWMGNGAFSCCYGLSSVSFSDTLITIDDQAFYQCYALSSVSIGESVKYIGAQAFYGCKNLTHVTVGKGVEFIGEKAFGSCVKLESIQVVQENTYYHSLDGNLYSTLDAELLQYATAKTARSFIIPSGTKIIGPGAFASCTALKSIVVPDTVTEIKADAFSGCTNLMNVYYTGTAEEWALITIGKNNNVLTTINKHYNYTLT